MITAWDIETFLLSRNQPCPQSVCFTFSDGQLLVPWESPSPYARLHRELDQGNILVGHNVCYDCAIACVEDPTLLPKVFDAFVSGQMRDTMIREKLIRIASGEGRFVVTADDEDGDDTIEPTRFDLGSTAWRWLKHFVNKKDPWRKKYATLYKVPLAQWPEGAKHYAIEDAVVTKRVYEAQQSFGTIVDEIPQHQAAFALKLMSVWGVRTERDAVARLKERLSKRQAETIMSLLPEGIFRVGGTKKAPKYVRTMKTIRAKVEAAYTSMGEPLPLTKKGALSTSTSTLRKSKDPVLVELAEALGAMKLLSSFIPVLESGTEAPICADYNVLVESGRTSCRGPNMQQLPRGTKEYQPRECFVARPEKAWVSVDYEMAELVAQGQMCIDLVGFSVLADQINAGQKPILAFAAKLCGMTYEDCLKAYAAGDPLVKKKRQDAKAAMYGLPGSMRAKKLWKTMTEFGSDISLVEAQRLEEQWRAEYPEFTLFFQHVQRQVGADYGSTGMITQLRSGRVRGGVDYPSACNTYFQGLVADAAKAALVAVTRECYLDEASPLFGSRVVAFCHDEIISECDIAQVHEVGYQIANLMKQAANKFMPSVRMEAEPCAMRRWSKDSFTKLENGKLVCCDS